MGIKIVVGVKGKALQKELNDDESKLFFGRKIGDKIPGDKIGFAGYEFEVTGGSDYCGFPMRTDVEGFARKRILAISGTGMKKKAKGIRQRKTVCGNTIHPKISQVNLKVVKAGPAPLVEEKAEEAPEKKEEKPAVKEEKPEKREEKKTAAEEKPAVTEEKSAEK